MLRGLFGGGPGDGGGGGECGGGDSALLRAARDEIVTHVRATYKETDLFRVFQTGDLANLDGLDAGARAKLPALAALRAALYSPAFRAFVRGVTGCGLLDGARADLSCNAYAPGGHLLCHDDVIGSRRVSFIVYLTDPDEPWDAAADGGALELYPLVSPAAAEEGEGVTAGVGGGAGGGGDTATLPPPSVRPSALLPPYWNSMALFVVAPGVSYHAVQEVTAPQGKARLSISGWFHAPSAEEEAAAAAEEAGAAEGAAAGAAAAGGGGGGAASLAQLLQLAPGADAVRGHARFVEQEGSGEEDEDEGLAAAARAKAEKMAKAAAKGGKGKGGGGGVGRRGEAAEAAAEAEAAADALAAARADRDPSERDLALLRRYVAPAYLDPKAWDAVRAKFAADGSVQLHGFLRPALAAAVRRAARLADAREGVGGGRLPRDYLVGTAAGAEAHSGGGNAGWSAAGPPHKQRYLRYGGGAAEGDALVRAAAGGEGEGEEGGGGGAGGREEEDAGALLAALRRDLFSSGAFARLLRRLTSVGMLGHAGEVRRFRPGLDYTVAHYGVLTSDPRLDCVLCFVDDGKGRAAGEERGGGENGGGAVARAGASGGGTSPTAEAEAWADGEVGGYEAYVLADDSDDGEEGPDGKPKAKGAAEVYRAVSVCLSLGFFGSFRRLCGLDALAKTDDARAPEYSQTPLNLLSRTHPAPTTIPPRQGPHHHQNNNTRRNVQRQDDGDAGVLNVPAAHNCLSLLLRDEGLMRFVKYVSAAAPGSRWDLAMEYLPDEGSSSEEEEQEEEVQEKAK